jgi:hypothetical protein
MRMHSTPCVHATLAGHQTTSAAQRQRVTCENSARRRLENSTLIRLPGRLGTACGVHATSPSGAEAAEGLRVGVTLQHTLGRAAGLFANKQIATNTAQGPQLTTYGALAQRVNQLGGVLKELGVQPGDRIATLAWNTATHLECYFAIPCAGAVLHTLNLRLFP